MNKKTESSSRKGENASPPRERKPAIPGGVQAADPGQILEVPLVVQAIDLLKLCSLSGAVGVIHGPNGTGKTEALRKLERDYPSLGLPGNVIRLRCCQQEGASRGIKDLLLEIGAGGVFVATGQTASVNLLCKAATRAFNQRDVRMLLLDEADLWDTAALGGLVSMLDYFKEKGRSVAAILTGAHHPSDWLRHVPALDSRTIHVIESENLDRAGMMGIFLRWGGALAEFATVYESGDAEAGKVAKYLFSVTAGNLRRIYHLSIALLEAREKITMETAEAAVRRTSK